MACVLALGLRLSSAKPKKSIYVPCFSLPFLDFFGFSGFCCFVRCFLARLRPPDVSNWENIQFFMENPNPTSQMINFSTQGRKNQNFKKKNQKSPRPLKPFKGLFQ